MKKRIALHLALLASAVAVFTATAVAKFSAEPHPVAPAVVPASQSLPSQ